MKSATSLGLRILTGVLLLAVLLVANPAPLLTALRGGDLARLAAAVVPFVAVLLLDALRFALLFEPYHLRYRTAVRVSLASMFVGSFTPGSLGGEAYRVYFLHRRAPGLVRPIALTVLLRLTGIGASLSLAGLYFAVYPGRIARGKDLLQIRWSETAQSAVGWIGLLLAAGLGVVMASPGGRALCRRAGVALAEASKGARRPLQLVGLALASLLVAAGRIAYLFLLARAFSPHLFLPDLAPVAAATAVAGALPITIGGLGTQEGALAAGLVLIGLPYPEAVAISLLNRGFLWSAAAAGWLSMGSSWREGMRPAT